ncbi:MAG TPA: hypothetical protein VG993_09310 [Actinomycetota bacterium]|nr:hypothetical protein [Actinomycetota bacterium]
MRRMTVVTVVLVIAGAALLTGSASASHFPHTKCSPSGDYCVSVKKIDGVRRLRLAMLFKYFPKHEVCVRKKGADQRTCHTYRTRRIGGLWGSSIDWRQQFPFEGRGVYRVSWRAQSRWLTSLTFHTGSPESLPA